MTKDLILEFVHHVPNLSCNLISVGKLTKDLKCVVNFSPNGCFFRICFWGRGLAVARKWMVYLSLRRRRKLKCCKLRKVQGIRMSDFHCEV